MLKIKRAAFPCKCSNATIPFKRMFEDLDCYKEIFESGFCLNVEECAHFLIKKDQIRNGGEGGCGGGIGEQREGEEKLSRSCILSFKNLQSVMG